MKSLYMSTAQQLFRVRAQINFERNGSTVDRKVGFISMKPSFVTVKSLTQNSSKTNKKGKSKFAS